MYKHQVIAIRRADSWRSRHSPKPGHIVGICTLEALHESEDAPGEWEFENFDPDENWEAKNGKVHIINPIYLHTDGLTVRCRYWTLEEVTHAMEKSTPQHQFFVRDENGQHKVFRFGRKPRLFTVVAGTPEPVYSRGKNELFIKGVAGGWLPFNMNLAPLYYEHKDDKVVYFVRKHKQELCIDRGSGLQAVECRAGDVHWISTPAGKPNLSDLPPHPELIVCDTVNHCPVIPHTAQPVVRGHQRDC